MHLVQHDLHHPPSSPYSNCLPHSFNLDQVTNHTHYCPCCIFLQKQNLDLSEDISWIEYLLTRPHPIPSPTFAPKYTPNPQANSSESFHKPHHNNQPSIFASKNTPSSHPNNSYEEHAQSRNHNPNLITNTSHLVSPTNAPSKTPSTHETPFSSIPSSSSINDYPK